MLPLRSKRAVHTATVTAVWELTPRMVRVTATAETFIGLEVRPAQDIELFLLNASGLPVKRRYTIRSYRPGQGEIDVDVFLHRHGLGSAWASTVQPGDTMEFAGPRGKLELRPADWHLFVGDEASVPAISALTEALGEQAATFVVAEVTDAADELPMQAHSVRWLHRRDHPTGTTALVEPAVQDLPLPPGTGHAYLLGESRVVSRLRTLMPALGVPHNNIFAKGYWNAPGRDRS
ncbi:siderophore-interacting protein [Sphaerisporangium sp. NPDC051011]|uniref:siderophore-interacting protein n=1 Tax=Sphaerisporangium sp. NPDC051011 TaxID=3155792 RepID=UPI003411A671